jgi:uncharacterized protein YacL
MKMTLQERVKTTAFLSWIPLFLYLTQNISGYGDAELFELDYGFESYNDGFSILFLFIGYFLALAWIAPIIEKNISERVLKKLHPFVHSVILTLILVIFYFVFNVKKFDFVFKLSFVWIWALLIWFFKGYSKA